MKTLFLTISIGLLSGSLRSQTSTGGIPAQKILQIESVMTKHMKTYDTPALSVVLVKNEKPTFINLGTYDRYVDRKVDEQSIYQIASLSKTLTAIIINNLIHQGILELNEPITTYLPNHYSAKTKQKLKVVTIRDILHHRSGIRRDSRLLLRIRKGNGNFEYEYSAADFDKELMKTKLKSGKKYRYSNLGYALLGYIAELSTGLSYEELLNKYITTPINMSSTSIKIKDNHRLVTAYRKDKKHKVIKPMVMGKLTPPSGLFTTTYDLSQLMIQQIHDYRNSDNSSLILSDDTFIHHQESGSAYGYGFRVFGDSGAMGHGGEMDGYASFYSINPGSNWGHAILSSSNGDELVELWQKIYQIMDSE